MSGIKKHVGGTKKDDTAEVCKGEVVRDKGRGTRASTKGRAVQKRYITDHKLQLE